MTMDNHINAAETLTQPTTGKTYHTSKEPIGATIEVNNVVFVHEVQYDNPYESPTRWNAGPLAFKIWHAQSEFGWRWISDDEDHPTLADAMQVAVSRKHRQIKRSRERIKRYEEAQKVAHAQARYLGTGRVGTSHARKLAKANKETTS